MRRERAAELYERLEERFGTDLRSVGYYDADGGDFTFIRDDVDEAYDEQEISRAFRNLRLEAMDRPTLDSLYSHGDLLCTVRIHEDATVIHVATSDVDGAVASVEAGVIGDLRETADLVLDVLASAHTGMEDGPSAEDEPTSLDESE